MKSKFGHARNQQGQNFTHVEPKTALARYLYTVWGAEFHLFSVTTEEMSCHQSTSFRRLHEKAAELTLNLWAY